MCVIQGKACVCICIMIGLGIKSSRLFCSEHHNKYNTILNILSTQHFLVYILITAEQELTLPHATDDSTRGLTLSKCLLVALLYIVGFAMACLLVASGGCCWRKKPADVGHTLALTHTHTLLPHIVFAKTHNGKTTKPTEAHRLPSRASLEQAKSVKQRDLYAYT